MLDAVRSTKRDNTRSGSQSHERQISKEAVVDRNSKNSNKCREKRGGHNQFHVREEMARPYEGMGLSKTLTLSWVLGGDNMPQHSTVSDGVGSQVCEFLSIPLFFHIIICSEAPALGHAHSLSLSQWERR